MFPREFRLGLHIFFLLVMITILLFAFSAHGDGSVKETTAEPGGKSSDNSKYFEKIEEDSAKIQADITADPANALAHMRLAYLLIEKGALDEAMKSFEEALRINPHLYDAKTGRGIVLVRRGDLKEAELVLKDALLLNPNPVRTHYELGLLYERRNDFEKAVAEFKEGIRKHEQGRK